MATPQHLKSKVYEIEAFVVPPATDLSARADLAHWLTFHGASWRWSYFTGEIELSGYERTVRPGNYIVRSLESNRFSPRNAGCLDGYVPVTDENV
jgi:hypothetical protein